jgi:hypothetical protein
MIRFKGSGFNVQGYIRIGSEVQGYFRQPEVLYISTFEPLNPYP